MHACMHLCVHVCVCVCVNMTAVSFTQRRLRSACSIGASKFSQIVLKLDQTSHLTPLSPSKKKYKENNSFFFKSSNLCLAAPCVSNIGTAVEHIYPLVSEFQMEKREIPEKKLKEKKFLQSFHHHAAAVNGFHDDEDDENFAGSDEEELYGSESDDDSFDSDVSHD